MIRTDRLVLRNVEAADLDALVKLWGNSDVAQFMGDFGPRGRSEVEGWLPEAVAAVNPEALALNRERIGRTDVTYVSADVFDWRPDRSYDVVFFSFWLSHVPRSRFGAFWSLVRSCLVPSGRAFLIDNRNDPTPGRKVKDPYVVEYGPDLHLRRLNDGSQYRVVKVMYEPDEVQSLIEAEGWHAEIDATRWFIFGPSRLS